MAKFGVRITFISFATLLTIALFFYNFDQRRTYSPFPKPRYFFTSNTNISHPSNVTILIWTEIYHSKTIHKAELAKQSPIPDWCTVTFDRSLLNESQALVFHVPGNELHMNDLPPMRKSEQVWVFFSIESPAYMHLNVKNWNKLQFNRTMSYRLDSDYPCPYGFLRKKKYKQPFISNYSQIQKKTHLAASMISHCPVRSQRGQLIKELKKYISIDQYGSCGTLACDRSDEVGCYERLGRKYKFYLALENSICTHYVTEKFSNALYANMVPVVYGGGGYKQIVPHKAFIDVMDFSSPRSLAEYLQFLDKNQTEYEKYFEWKKEYDIIIRQGYNGFNVMCHSISEGNLEKNFYYDDMEKWWAGSNCKHGKQWKS